MSLSTVKNEVKIDKESVRAMILASGAIKVGFAASGNVKASVMSQLREWITAGNHATMNYLQRHVELKENSESVLPEAATVISVAFSYAPEKFRDTSLPSIACYAYGDDYHEVIRNKLSPVVEQLRSIVGGEWRICIDSAPLAERYWAVKSGLGIRGANGSVIVNGAGCYSFLAEIVTTIPFVADAPSCEFISCGNCGACRKACPQMALSEDGIVDSRRCLNYLTIEHRDVWENMEAEAMSTSAGCNTLFGCDRCLRVCPHNRDVAPTGIKEFKARESVMLIDADEALSLTRDEFSRLFKGSAIKRTKFEGWQRNALHVLLNLMILVFSSVFICAAEGKYDSLMSSIADMSSTEIIELADSTEKIDNEKALVMWLTVCHRLSDNLSDKDCDTISYAHLRAGNIHYARGNYSNALELFVKGLKICEQSDSKRYIMRFYNNIGNVYSVFEEYEKGINYFNKGLEKGQNRDDERQSLYNILVNVTGMYAYLNNIEQARKSYDALIKLKGFDSPEQVFMKKYDLGLIKKCENKPYEHISIFKELVDYAKEHNLPPHYECSVYEELYKAYYSLADYDSTLLYLNKCASLSAKSGISHMYPNVKKTYSEVYEAQGNLPKALQFKSDYLNIKDSIYNQRQFEVVKNQQFLYEIEQTESKISSMNAEKTRHIQVISNQRKLIASILIGIIVAGILLIKVWVQKQRLLKSYEKLYTTHRDSLTHSSVSDSVPIEDASATTPSASVKYGNSNLSEEQKKELSRSIIDVMENKQPYCSPDFSLEQLASEVGSNMKYVSQVINEVFGKNFSNYVNEYRVKLVCVRLLDKEHFGHLTIKAISEGVGFKSQSTFIKVFRNIIGMPPSMYQRLAKKDNIVANS